MNERTSERTNGELVVEQVCFMDGDNVGMFEGVEDVNLAKVVGEV